MGISEAVTRFDQPWKWLVIFHRECGTFWVNRLVPGRYKHVSAVGWSARTGVWVFYDPAIDKTSILTAHDDEEGLTILAKWIEGATVVQMPLGGGSVWRWRFGFWCVPAIAHLIGIRSGAVRPSRLLLDCLAQGGRLIQRDGQPQHEGIGTQGEAGPGARGDGSPVGTERPDGDPEDGDGRHG